MILFLGSGVSLASGLPSVDTIRKHLRYAHGNPNIQALLDLLETINADYIEFSAPYKAGARSFKCTDQIYGNSTTYEDLFYLANRIALNGCGLLNDATAESFSEAVRKQAKPFLKRRTKIERRIELIKLASQTTRFIEKEVANLLIDKKIIGLNLIKEMANSTLIDKLDIVTLNHDIIVEKLLSNGDIEYCDGFGDQDGDLRFFEDLFPERVRISLIKLHGSINWYRTGDTGIVRPAAITSNDITRCKDARGKLLISNQSIPSFLSGQSKVFQYNRGIFADMQYRFQQTLRRNNLIIMSGYGWGDVPINFHLQYWLDKNKYNRLVLLYEQPDKLKEASKEMAEMYDVYTRKGRIIPISQWLQNTSIEDLKDQLFA